MTLAPPSMPRYLPATSSPFIASIGVDQALAPMDLAGSVAHAQMLARTGLLTDAEAATLVGGLRRIHQEVRGGQFRWRVELEDVHTNIEVRLTELVGRVAGKLHTARSRNDQVAVDERLWLRAAILRTGQRLVELELALLDQARSHLETAFPGYTHLQRAQPVTLGHHLMAHVWRFDRDSERLRDLSRRSEVCPLGAGALAGTTLAIDPAWVASQLGFSRMFENSMDAVSDRDALVEFLFVLSLLAVHLSAIAEEVVWWASREVGFVLPSSSLGAGSSLMPQKQNPDVAELVRAKTGRVVGDLVALLIVLKGLPMTYNRDLQEDKRSVFEAAETTDEALNALTRVVGSLEFDLTAIGRAVDDPGLTATDRVEELVSQGMAFREAHEQVGAELLGDPPRPSALDRSPLGAEVRPPRAPREAYRRRTSPGGPSPASVQIQLTEATRRLEEQGRFLSELADRVARVDRILEEESP